MRGVVSIAVGLVALGVLAGPAQATFPGANGKLAVTMGPPPGIATVNPDGTGLSRLTSATLPTWTFTDQRPTWSGEGQRIAFLRFHLDGSRPELRIMDANGANQRLVRTLEFEPQSRPAWSPDGREIAVARHDALEIIDTADGSSRLLRPTGSPDSFDDADWSPDGREIVITGRFVEERCDPPDDPNECELGPGEASFYRVAVDGTAITPIPVGGTLDDNDIAPSWSPSGDEIAFQRDFSGLIGIVDADGGTPRHVGAGASRPVWSPDGTKLAYDGGTNETFGDVFTINANGGGATKVLDGSPGETAAFGSPDWQPVTNRAPDCSGVRADPSELWPPNHKLRTVSVSGATDPDGDAVTLHATGATHDGPGGDDADAHTQDETIRLRAERNPRGATRIYTVSFTATDAQGASCTGDVTITVPGPKS